MTPLIGIALILNLAVAYAWRRLAWHQLAGPRFVQRARRARVLETATLGLTGWPEAARDRGWRSPPIRMWPYLFFSKIGRWRFRRRMLRLGVSGGAQGPANGGVPVGIGTTNLLTKWLSATVVGAAMMTQPWADVGAYGADTTGAADSTTAIQNAIASLQPGGRVWVPSGVYKTNTAGAPLTVTTFHVQIVGASKQDCTFKTNHATSNVLEFNSWYCSISGITFDTFVARTGGYAVKFTDGNNRHMVIDCEIDNHKNGVLMGAHLGVIDGLECRTFVNGGSWVEINCSASSAHDQYIHRLTGDNGGANKNAAGTAGVRLIQCASLVMDSCNLVNGGGDGACHFNPGAGQVIPSVYCANVFFDQSGFGVLFTGNATGTVQRVKFSQCWFATHTNDGVRMNSPNAAGLQGIDFLNCDFYQNVNGINALAGYEDWTVRGSRFSGNTTTGILTSAIATGRFSICDNFIGNGSGFGANALGVNIQAGTYKSYQILDNRGLDTNTTPGITDAGSVGATDYKNVGNNLGALLKGVLASIGANVVPGTAETVVLSARIPANAVKVGDIFRVHAIGTITTVGNPTPRIRVGANGTTADNQAWVISAAPVGVVNTVVHGIWLLTVKTIGAGGTIQCEGNFINSVTLTTRAAAAPATAAINTTAAWFIDFTNAMSIGAVTWENVSIEAL